MWQYINNIALIPEEKETALQIFCKVNQNVENTKNIDWYYYLLYLNLTQSKRTMLVKSISSS